MRDAQHVPATTRGLRERGPIRRWGVGAIAATALGTLLLVVVPVATGAAGGAAAGYVALGDSYTAGPLIPNQENDPLGCLRSDHDYPTLAAAALGLGLTDMSCSGATTADMTSSQGVTPGPNPPQFGAITPATSVVTLSIGGNDVGFVSILENCAALTPWGPTKVGQTCQGYYDPNGNDQLGAQIKALEPKIASLVKQIHGLAPSAKVFVVGYPAILPSTGACWPSMPLETSDALYLRSKEIQLDGVLKTAATQNGATFVDTYGPSASHNACTSESRRWVEPLFPGSSAAPVHPNAAGMAGIAGVLETVMRNAGIS